MRPQAATSDDDPLLASLNSLAIEYRRAIAEASLLSDICLRELGEIRLLVAQRGDPELRRLVERRLASLPARLRLATAPTRAVRH